MTQDAREEWIKCIAHTHADLRRGNPWKPDGTRDEGQPRLAWCGRDVTCGFSFMSVDHALYNAASGGRLVACGECIAAVAAAAQAAALGSMGELATVLDAAAKEQAAGERVTSEELGGPR